MGDDVRKYRPNGAAIADTTDNATVTGDPPEKVESHGVVEDWDKPRNRGEWPFHWDLYLEVCQKVAPPALPSAIEEPAPITARSAPPPPPSPTLWKDAPVVECAAARAPTSSEGNVPGCSLGSAVREVTEGAGRGSGASARAASRQEVTLPFQASPSVPASARAPSPVAGRTPSITPPGAAAARPISSLVSSTEAAPQAESSRIEDSSPPTQLGADNAPVYLPIRRFDVKASVLMAAIVAMIGLLAWVTFRPLPLGNEEMPVSASAGRVRHDTAAAPAETGTAEAPAATYSTNVAPASPPPPPSLASSAPDRPEAPPGALRKPNPALDRAPNPPRQRPRIEAPPPFVEPPPPPPVVASPSVPAAPAPASAIAPAPPPVDTEDEIFNRPKK